MLLVHSHSRTGPFDAARLYILTYSLSGVVYFLGLATATDQWRNKPSDRFSEDSAIIILK